MLTRVESGFGVSEIHQVEDQAAVAEISGIVTDLDDLVATVEMGPDREEWVFPRSMLPADIELDSVLTFDGVGSAATVVAHRHPAPSVEDRMERALNRRRMQPH
jgi:hypothetical protein